MANEDSTALIFGKVNTPDERAVSLPLDPGFNEFSMRRLVNFSNTNTHLALVGGEGMVFITQARELS